mgnify:CR=1 FL=1
MSKALATKNVAAVLLSVVMAFGLIFAFATPAKADVISDLQAQINALLAQISALQGGSSSSASCTAFTRNHQQNDSGGEVMAIQKFLNSHGAQIAASGAGSPGNETSFFGGLTKAAVAKFQAANGISPAVGYWGPITRAKANSQCTGTPGVPGVPMTGNGLRVSLASDSPSFGSLVQGQAIGELAKFTFSNPTAAPITVTNVTMKRIGASADSVLSSIYLYQGATRLTDAGGVSSSVINFNNTSGIFTLAPGASVVVSVRADILSTAGGQSVGVQLTSVASSGTLDSSTILPISGATLLISNAAMGTIVFTYTGPSNASENPTSDVRVFEASTVVSTHKARLEAITFENRGTSDDNDFQNLKLFVDGTQVGTAVATLTNSKAIFDLSTSPVTLDTGTRIIKVTADIVGGSGETYDFQIRRGADLRAVDVELGQPVLATDASTVTGFPVSAATANTVAAATLSITRAANSPSSNVSLGGTNILLSRFEVRAAGENVKIEAVTLDVDTTAGNGMDNGKIFLNGAQIGSTLDVGGASSETGTEFTFGSSFIARQGQTEILEIYGDAKTAAGTNFADASTVVAGVSVAAADTEGMDSGDAVSAISIVDGFTRTITTSSVTVSKYSGYGDQTLVAGSNDAKLGAFTLSSGSTEGVNVNTITITLSSDEAASITNLRLVDSVTGVQIGSTKVSPSTSNSYSVTVNLPASGTKTINLIGNVKSGANVGSWAAQVDGSGTGATTATSVTFGSATLTTGTLQTITIATTGTITAAVGVSPDNANVVAGSSEVKVGSFNFTSTNSDFTVQELIVKVPNDAATSVSSVTLKWPSGGVATQSLAASSTLPSATATFTGLTFNVPMNTTKTLDVYVSIPTITSGAKSGAAITATLDFNEGFKAVDGAGNSDTSLAAADLASSGTTGKGTMYVRKSKPTLAAVALDSTALNSGSSQVLGRFSVSADAAGDVDWGSVVITLDKTSAVTVGATSTLAIWSGSNQIAGTIATTSAATTAGVDACLTQTTCLLHFRPTTVETIPAGTSKTYELRGTVGGVTTSGSNFISASIANPQTSASSTAVFGSAAGTQGVSTAASFVWSDWSDLADHSAGAMSASTADWTGDYLIKTLPLTIGNRSLTI